MEFTGKLIKRVGDKGYIEIENIDWFEVNKKASGTIIVEIEEKDHITDKQRRLMYALWRDYEDYTGTPEDAAKSWFKYQYMLDRGLDTYPSVARGAMTKSMATDFITYILEYYLNNGIPFTQQDWYKGADIARVCYAMLMNRICFICGKPNSDVHHLTGFRIGMGNNRRKVDHTGRLVACFCRNDHNIVHIKGEKEIFDEYHIVPVKLSEEDAKQLGVM